MIELLSVFAYQFPRAGRRKKPSLGREIRELEQCVVLFRLTRPCAFFLFKVFAIPGSKENELEASPMNEKKAELPKPFRDKTVLTKIEKALVTL